MPGEMSLFSALQKELLEKQEELDQACGTRYAGNRETLLSLITDELPRYQLYTETIAKFVLKISAHQASLLQRVRQLDGLPLSAEYEREIVIEHPRVLARKLGQAAKAPGNKSFWVSPLSLLGTVFSNQADNTALAEPPLAPQSSQKKNQANA